MPLKYCSATIRHVNDQEPVGVRLVEQLADGELA
jgi:hypothetical protein